MNEYANFDAFSPLDYLQSYYGVLGSEADGLLSFHVSEFARLKHNLTVLELGGGPTIISLIPAARKAAYIHFTDFSPANRQTVRSWLHNYTRGFDWSPYFYRTLQLEGIAHPRASQVAFRMAQVRQSLRQISRCDLNQTPPVPTESEFDVVIANYCLDAVTDSKAQWHVYLRKVLTLLKPGGVLLMATLKQTHFYDFGATRYHNVFLDENDVHQGLIKAGYAADSIRISTAEPDHPEREYQGVIFSSAAKPH